MLSYEEFKNTFYARFPEVMGPEFEGYVMKHIPVVKRGKKLDGFTFCNTDTPDDQISMMPTYYFDDIYQSYLQDEDLNRELNNVSSSMKMAYIRSRSLLPKISIKNIRKNVIMELVNTDFAGAYLYDVPHRDFLNMSVVYRWVVNIDDTGVYSCMIDNDLLSAASLTEDELFENAVKNTKRLIVPQVKNFDTVVRKMMRRDGRSEAEIRNLIGKIDKERRIYVITNKHNFRASTAIIYKDVLRSIALKAESDIYIVPTSVNESLVVPVKTGISPENLQMMLDESNQYYLGGEDQILSDTLYFYSADSDQLSVMDNKENVYG